MCELLLINNKYQPCAHSAFLKNKCVWCKKPKQDCNNSTTLPFRYIHPYFSLTFDAIQHLRDRNFKTLLDRKKLHLVLDLDNTLVHSISTEKRLITLENRKKISTSYKDVFEIFNGDRLVKLRPRTCEFLEQASIMFDLSICTMGGELYAKEVSRVLRSKAGKKRFRFEAVIAREHCTKSDQKGLDVVLSHERVVLIVDDLEQIWGDEHKANLIKIKPYKFFEMKNNYLLEDDDQELTRVLGVLKKVHKIFYYEEERYCGDKDVRKILEMIEIESLIDELSIDLSKILEP